ncbi:MAG: UDP-N-acetylmuramate--L-alanine ligase [Acutalibacteraceae bacterium]|jgi:UDP-N-acetylmuramate--alanine ligase
MEQDLLQSAKHIYFAGIGGSGMSPLADILHARGYRISGSDINESDNLARMRSLGIPVTMEQVADNVTDDIDLFVYTNAVGANNPELLQAIRMGIPVLERAKLLGLITRRYPRTVAVAGTHGKTTTSSMLSQILIEAGKDPAVFIGGRLPLIGANGRAGDSDIMVCEACEFQDHYLEMRPAISIILNIDADHLDYFGSLDGVIRSFQKFAALTGETLIVNRDDPHAGEAVKGITGKTVVTYGVNGDAEWTAKNVTFVNGSYGQYDLYHNGKFFAAITLGIPGEHNVGNSMAAAAAAHLYGVPAGQIAAGIASFRGAGRRFEFLGTFGGVTVVDDYAHHPTEIRATVSAAKKLGHERVWAVFQPFTFSRTAQHLEEFAAVLSEADVAVVCDIMGSREQNTYGVSSRQITDRIPNGVYQPTFEDVTRYVVDNVRPGDLVLTMGGGDIYKCARMIARRLDETTG